MSNHLRIDKWLWHTRFFKTRSLATAAVRGGRVKVNGERVKPGYRIAVGDRVDVQRARVVYEVTVTKVPERRGPASAAALCYHEDEAALERRQGMVDALRADYRQLPMTRGRPDKRTRRALRIRGRTPEGS